MRNLIPAIGLVLALFTTSAAAQSNGNPFTYSSWQDQQSACNGISSGASYHCAGIVNNDDRLMCYAMADRNPNPCASIADLSLSYACLAMASPTPSSTWCNSIPFSNNNLRNFCFGVSTRDQSFCSYITDRDTQLLCYGMAVAPHYSSNCNTIIDWNARYFCYGVAGQGPVACSNIQP